MVRVDGGSSIAAPFLSLCHAVVASLTARRQWLAAAAALHRAEQFARGAHRSQHAHLVTPPQPRLDMLWLKLAVAALETARRDVGLSTGEASATPLIDLSHPAACFGAGIMAFLEERGTAPDSIGVANRHALLTEWRALRRNGAVEEHTQASRSAGGNTGAGGGIDDPDGRAAAAASALRRGRAWFSHGQRDVGAVLRCFRQAGGRALPEVVVCHLLLHDVEAAVTAVHRHLFRVFPAVAQPMFGTAAVSGGRGVSVGGRGGASTTFGDATPAGAAQFKPPQLARYKLPWEAGVGQADAPSHKRRPHGPGRQPRGVRSGWHANGHGHGDGDAGEGGDTHASGHGQPPLPALPCDVRAAAAVLVSVAACHLARPDAPVYIPTPATVRRSADALRKGGRLPAAAGPSGAAGSQSSPAMVAAGEQCCVRVEGAALAAVARMAEAWSPDHLVRLLLGAGCPVLACRTATRLVAAGVDVAGLGGATVRQQQQQQQRRRRRQPYTAVQAASTLCSLWLVACSSLNEPQHGDGRAYTAFGEEPDPMQGEHLPAVLRRTLRKLTRHALGSAVPGQSVVSGTQDGAPPTPAVVSVLLAAEAVLPALEFHRLRLDVLADAARRLCAVVSRMPALRERGLAAWHVNTAVRSRASFLARGVDATRRDISAGQYKAWVPHGVRHTVRAACADTARVGAVPGGGGSASLRSSVLLQRSQSLDTSVVNEELSVRAVCVYVCVYVWLCVWLCVCTYVCVCSAPSFSRIHGGVYLVCVRVCRLCSPRICRPPWRGFQCSTLSPPPARPAMRCCRSSTRATTAWPWRRRSLRTLASAWESACRSTRPAWTMATAASPTARQWKTVPAKAVTAAAVSTRAARATRCRLWWRPWSGGWTPATAAAPQTPLVPRPRA